MTVSDIWKMISSKLGISGMGALAIGALFAYDSMQETNLKNDLKHSQDTIVQMQQQQKLDEFQRKADDLKAQLDAEKNYSSQLQDEVGTMQKGIETIGKVSATHQHSISTQLTATKQAVDNGDSAKAEADLANINGSINCYIANYTTGGSCVPTSW